MATSLIRDGESPKGGMTMGSIKYSTGKGSRVRHSTAMEWDEMEDAKKRSGYQELKHSTGEKPAIKHATGVEFDYKAMIDERSEEESQGLRSKVQSKSILPGDEYLGEYHQTLLKKRREDNENWEFKKETKK